MAENAPLPSSSIVNFEEIKRRRLALTLTMDEAAVRAGYTGTRGRAWWNDIESGANPDPRISTMAKVAHVLRCRIETLLVAPPSAAAGRPQKKR